MILDRARPHLRAHAIGRAMRLAVSTSSLALLMLLAAGCERKTVDDYLKMGDQATRDSKLAEAENDYQSAIQLAPNDPRTHIALGNLYVFEQKPGPAQLEFMKVLELDPKNAPAHAALANLYAGQSQLGMAEAQWRAATVLDPPRADYRLQLAAVLMKQAKQSEAEAELRTAIGLDPKNGQAHFALANLLNSETGRDTEAQTEYAQAKALDPRLAPPTAAEAASAPTVASAPAAGHKIKPLDKRFVLTRDSPVYEGPDASGRVVGRVHNKRFVHVIGITGDWFQIKMHTGVVGFIPVKTAE